MNIEAIISLLIGIAVFIVGMNTMSSGLKKVSGKGLKRLLQKIQNNRLAGLLIGTAITALIQSSAATSIMVVGFINAGVMSLFQGISITMGAYIGTTVTGILVSLSSFSFSSYLVLLAFIGVILMFFKNEKIKSIGQILCGLGLLFFGLSTMSAAFGSPTDTSSLSYSCQGVFEKVSFPLLLLLIGALFTALVQSSSATSGIVIVMVGNGAIPFSSGLYLVLGATIGTVISTILATIDSSTNSKRLALVCLLERITGALIATIIVWCFQDAIGNFFATNFSTTEFGLAIFLVLYNVIFMGILLPFIKPFEDLSCRLIKDKQEEVNKKAIKFIDPHMLNTPSIAFDQAKKEIENMLNLSYENLIRGFEKIKNHNKDNDQTIIETEDQIDYINNQLTPFLITLSHNLNEQEGKIVGSYFHVINDIERIGDHAYNFYELSIKMSDEDLQFSDKAFSEFDQMFEIILKMYQIAKKVFLSGSEKELKYLHELEDQTDKLKISLSDSHYERIVQKTCKVELSPFYSTLISELERIADHLVNIGYSIVNPTGDEEK